jgi:3-dehydroquinate dehydratase I
VSIVGADPAAIERAEPLADLFEVRIDLIGGGWREVAGRLEKPWLACNRRAAEGGRWRGDEAGRIGELFSAVDLGAGIVDIELASLDIEKVVREIKSRRVQALVSHHDLAKTPPLEELQELVKRQLAAGADICKVVTTAHTVADNIAVLELIGKFPGNKIAAFAIGEAGQLSRVLSPLAGGYFTYASPEAGQESAAGQLTAQELKTIYGMLENV